MADKRGALSAFGFLMDWAVRKASKQMSKALARLLSGQVVKTIASSEQYQTSLNVFFPVPIVQKTVGQYAKHIVYYSETEDPSIPTENIGVPNTERGNVVILNVLM